MKPYRGRILWVDLTAGTCTNEEVPESVYHGPELYDVTDLWGKDTIETEETLKKQVVGNRELDGACDRDCPVLWDDSVRPTALL